MSRNLPSLSARGPLTGVDGALRLEAILKMLLAFRDRPDDATTTARVYVETTADLPLDALTDACARFSKGMVDGHNNAFAPSTAELCAEGQRIVKVSVYKVWHAAKAALAAVKADPAVLEAEIVAAERLLNSAAHKVAAAMADERGIVDELEIDDLQRRLGGSPDKKRLQ